MITKEQFLKALKYNREFNEHADAISSTLRASDFYESPIVENGNALFDLLIDSNFSEEGRDWVYWYLYEDGKIAYYADGTQIKLESDEDLWDLVKNYGIQ